MQVDPERGDGDARRALMHSRHDKDGVYLSVSEGARALLGYEPHELVGTSAYSYFHPEDLAIIASSHARVLGMPDTATVSYRIRHRDGTYRSVTTTSVQHRSAPHAAIEIDSVTTPSRLAPGPASHHQEGQQFSYLVERTRSIVAVLDPTVADIRYANPLLEHAVGATPGSLVGASFFELIDPATLANLVGLLSGLLHRPRSTMTLRCGLRRLDGGTIPVSTVIQDLSNDPAVNGLLVVAHETITTAPPSPTTVNELDAPAARVLDRSMLYERLVTLFADPAHVRAGVSLATIQLDELDTAATALGSDSAERILDEAAERVAKALGTAGHADVARLGVGKLAMIATGIADPVAARTLGERLRDVLGLPFLIGQGEVFITPRVAVGTSQPGATADGLLASSHSALEQAGPGSRVTTFTTARRDVADAQLRLRAELHHAIERDEFVLHYQPCLSLDGNTIAGAEALIRWQHPERGLLAPGEFLPMAEQSDFIVPLGIWVLQAGCNQLAQWAAILPGPPPQVAINVSTHQLTDDRFLEAVADTLTLTGIPADRLCLEITETALLDTQAQTSAVLNQLVELGVQLAIDDFGAGHTNLTYLKRLPAHVVKIDQSFIAGLDRDDPDDTAIVAGTVAIAHALGRTVTAEGIETHKQLAAVRDLGCDHAQGYLLGRPVPADQLHTSLITAQRPTRACN